MTWQLIPIYYLSGHMSMDKYKLYYSKINIIILRNVRGCYNRQLFPRRWPSMAALAAWMDPGNSG